MSARLGLDTATPYLALALWSPEHGVLARRAPQVARDHAARLIPELDALFATAGVQRREVRAVTAGIGPGSYTGVRVGLAAAHALATAWDVPLGGAGTLAQMAAGALAPGETGVAVVDARRDAVYAGVYLRRAEDDVLQCLEAPQKRARVDVRRAWPDARWLEDVAPDAAWAARRPPGEEPATALYL